MKSNLGCMISIYGAIGVVLVVDRVMWVGSHCAHGSCLGSAISLLFNANGRKNCSLALVGAPFLAL